MSKRYVRRESLLTLVTSYNDCKVKINKKRYMEITTAFMKFIAKKILNGEIVHLPVRMGTLTIIGRKQIPKIEGNMVKGLATDWKSTLALWERDPKAKEEKKRIYFFNEHSNGVRYKIGWLKKDATLFDKNIMFFSAVRDLKRSIWRKIVDEKKEYQIL